MGHGCHPQPASCAHRSNSFGRTASKVVFDGDGICRLSDLIPIQNLIFFLNGQRERTVVGWQAQENSSRLTRAGLISLPMDSLARGMFNSQEICLRWRDSMGGK